MVEHIEVEGRFKVKDIVGFQKRLTALKAKFVGKQTITDYNFTLKSRDFWGSVEGLRVRMIAGKRGGILTYKPSGLKNARIMKTKEYETYVDAPKDLIKIFTFLDIIPLKYLPAVAKSRYIYKYHNASIAIDKYPGLGNFVDIEFLAKSRKEAQRFKAGIDEMALLLGFKNNDRLTHSVGFILRNIAVRKKVQ